MLIPTMLTNENPETAKKDPELLAVLDGVADVVALEEVVVAAASREV